MSKIWFITGANRGFGRVWAEAALARGDKVAATSRKPEALQELADRHGGAILPLELDVTNRAAVKAAVDQAVAHFGAIDVVINNAGFGLFGAVEEVSENQVRTQMDVNFFGVLNVTQAVLPIMRRQGQGHLIQVTSMGGVMAFPNLGAYHASKWAVEGLTESLVQEVGPLGIKVSMIEPGGYETDWGGSSSVHAEPLPAYDFIRQGMRDMAATMPPNFVGNPNGTANAVLKLVDAEEPPLRLFLGIAPTQMIGEVYAKRLQTWKDWEQVSIEANGK